MLNVRLSTFLSRFTVATTLCLALLSTAASPLDAAEQATLAITSFSLETKPDTVLIQSDITLHDATDVRTLLRGGAKILLRCSATLEKNSTFFLDKRISEHTQTFLVCQDSLTREFIASDGQRTFRLKQLTPLLQLAWKETPLNLTLSEPLEQGEKYQLSLRINLEYADLPAWMEKNLLFWSREVVPPLYFSQSFRF